MESFLYGIFSPTFVMSPFLDFRYQTSESKKSNTISTVEAKQGDFCPGLAMNILGGLKHSEGGNTKTQDVKTQCLGVLVKSVRAGLGL